MALKTIKKCGLKEEEGYYKGIFLKEEIYNQLNKYSLSTQKEQSEIINNLLESFFKKAKQKNK